MDSELVSSLVTVGICYELHGRCRKDVTRCIRKMEATVSKETKDVLHRILNAKNFDYTIKAGIDAATKKWGVGTNGETEPTPLSTTY